MKEYEGRTTRSDGPGRNGGGNREAYLIALESTANEARHSVIAGNAPPGAVLRLRKSFLTKTSPVLDASGQEGPVQTFADVLDTTMQVPGPGSYRYHANPSTRPTWRSSAAVRRPGPRARRRRSPAASPARPPMARRPSGDADSDLTRSPTTSTRSPCRRAASTTPR